MLTEEEIYAELLTIIRGLPSPDSRRAATVWLRREWADPEKRRRRCQNYRAAFNDALPRALAEVTRRQAVVVTAA